MAEPSSFQCPHEVAGFLTLHNSCNLVLGGQVNDAEDWNLLLLQLNPHHIGLQLLVEVGGLWKGSRCGSVGLPISFTGTAVELLRNIENFI